jgi:hypothetical protein
VQELALSWVKDGKRSTSWFSKKEPYRLRSRAAPRSVLSPETRSLMLPLDDLNARRIQ